MRRMYYQWRELLKPVITKRGGSLLPNKTLEQTAHAVHLIDVCHFETRSLEARLRFNVWQSLTRHRLEGDESGVWCTPTIAQPRSGQKPKRVQVEMNTSPRFLLQARISRARKTKPIPSPQYASEDNLPRITSSTPDLSFRLVPTPSFPCSSTFFAPCSFELPSWMKECAWTKCTRLTSEE